MQQAEVTDDVGPLLRAGRQHALLSQRALAEAAGVAPRVVARAESGGHLRWATLRRLLAACGCGITVLDRVDRPLGEVWAEDYRDRAGRALPAHLDAWPVAELGTFWYDAKMTTVHRPPWTPGMTFERASVREARAQREASGMLGRVAPLRTRAELAAMLDVTLLKPEATADEVAALCATAAEVGAAAVCVSPARLPLPAGLLPPSVAVCTVVGFPSGAHRSQVKAAEARQAVTDGATELDVVVDLGRVRAADWAGVRADVAAVREETPGVLKVIVESAVLDDDTLRHVCTLAEEAGADFVKTSTGFHPAGGHTVHAVRVMAAAVGGRLGVKASGGVRTTEQALAVVEAGATRIGASSVAALLDGLPED